MQYSDVESHTPLISKLFVFLKLLVNFKKVNNFKIFYINILLQLTFYIKLSQQNRWIPNLNRYLKKKKKDTFALSQEFKV